MRLKNLTLTFLLIQLAAGLSAESKKRAGAPDGTEEIKYSMVTGILSPEARVKAAVKRLSDCLLHDYASPMTAVRIISSDGRYREVQAGSGIFVSTGFTQKAARYFWDDPGANGSFRFADVFITEALHPEENKKLPALSVPFDAGSEGIEQMNTGYSDSFNLSALDKKRSLELYSPLNIKRINDFEYCYGDNGDTDGEDSCIVLFKSRKNISWNKTRIRCSGKLHIDRSGTVRKIEIENLEDRYTNFIRQDCPFSDIVTPCILTVEYSSADGKIYVSSIRQSLRWSLEGIKDPDGFHYYAEPNPYRLPFKYRYSTETIIDFGRPSGIAGKDLQIAEAGITIQPAAYNTLHLCGPADYNYWKRTLARYIDLAKLEHDTGMSWDELCVMAESRQAREEAAALGRPDMNRERIDSYKSIPDRIRRLILDICQ